MSIRMWGIALALTLGVVGVAPAQTSISAASAEKLTRLLQDRKLRHFAASDPAEKGRYVAAMLVGDSMLFVVAARYAQPVLLDDRLSRGDHEGIYIELNSASEKEGRFFVQDLGAPGLHPTRDVDKPFDIVYGAGDKRTAFDGDWAAQKLSQETYASAFDEADKLYARALELLVAAIEGSAGSQTVPRS